MRGTPDTIQIENFLSVDSVNEDGILTVDEDNVKKDVNLVKMAYYFSQGYDAIDIAELMQLNRSTVKKVLNSEEFKAVMNSISIEVVSVARMFLASAGIKAVRTLIDCLDSPNDKIRIKAATEVLDRIGLTEPKKIELMAEGSAFGNMSDTQMLELLKHGMSELMGSEGEGEDYE